MKTYPSIPRANNNIAVLDKEVYVFDKLDGSNLRFEWDKKQGWHRYGTRTRLFDITDKVFGESIAIFKDTMAKEIEDTATASKWESVTAYCEFYGKNSFAGSHESSDSKRLSLFDVAPYKKGILGPEEFLDKFGHLNIAIFLGKHLWTREFIEEVRRSLIPGVTFEGVIGKAGEGHKLTMVKAKTQLWITKVKEKYSPEEAKMILES